MTLPDFWNDARADEIRAQLQTLGFPDSRRALQLARGLAKTSNERAILQSFLEVLLRDVSESSDPERALVNLSRLLDGVAARDGLLLELRDQPAFARRLMKFLSFSQTLCDDVIRDSQLLDTLRQPLELPSRAQLRTNALRAATPGELRLFKRREALKLAVFDLDRQTWRDVKSFSRLVQGVSDLAQVCVQAALCFAARELNVTTLDGFCVLAMGKMGARELNYSSDIDLIFLREEHSRARELGDALLKLLTESSPNGTLYRVDLRLRPDGGNGPLVTPFAYALSYYESYAGAWEHQALLKARVVAGDARLGRRFRRFTRAIVWARRGDDAHLREVVELKRRAESTPEGRDTRNVKTGPGGIRDGEWACQFTQLMTGPAHARARASATLRALPALENFGALSPVEARALEESYLFLRVVEHRLQLRDEKAVRVLPKTEAETAALARRLGFTSRGTVAARQLREEVARHQKDVRSLCERLVLAFRPDVGRRRAATPPAPRFRHSREPVARAFIAADSRGLAGRVARLGIVRRSRTRAGELGTTRGCVRQSLVAVARFGTSAESIARRVRAFGRQRKLVRHLSAISRIVGFGRESQSAGASARLGTAARRMSRVLLDLSRLRRRAATF